MKEITKENFNQFVKDNKVVVIDFWAAWCGPCQMYGSVFEKTGKEVKGAAFAKVNVDEEAELAEKFQVMSIPMTVIIKEGKVVDTLRGAVPKETLKKEVEKFI